MANRAPTLLAVDRIVGARCHGGTASTGVSAMRDRVLVTTGIYPPDVGGPARSVPVLIATWRALGCDAEVLCYADDPHAHPADGVVRIDRHQAKPIRFVTTVSAIRRIARTSRAVFANGLHLEAYVGALLARRPLVVKIVGDEAWERAQNRGWTSLTLDAYQAAPKSMRDAVLDWLRAFPVRRATAVVVPSVYLAGIVRGWGVAKQRVHVVPNAVPSANRAEGSTRVASRSIDVVTVCRLVPWKGVSGLLHALARLPRVSAQIVGDGPEFQHLQELAQSLDISDRVVFRGRLNRSETEEVMANSKVLVLNSSYEGLPHVVLEAMAAGTAVIAADSGGTAEIVKHEQTGLLVPYADDAALASGIERLLANPALAESLAVSALANLDRFHDVTSMARHTLDVVQGAHGAPRLI